ncbi:hypothetical protein [Streptomyces lydicus]|uniref:hypothetical protein n=1 Tax=Streptomyces lydicus TaxID=47763 RepID=UPI003428F60D
METPHRRERGNRGSPGEGPAPLALPQVRRQWPVIRRHLGFLALAALLGVALGAGSRR